MKSIIIFVNLIVPVLLMSQVSSEWRGPGRTGVYKNETGLLKQWPTNGPELLWHVDSIPKGYSSVAVANNKVYVTGIINNMDVIVAFDNSGIKLWETPYGRAWDSSFGHSRCTPTIESERIFLLSGLGDVSCVDANTGSIIWSVKVSELFGGSSGRFGYSESLLIVDDKVFFTTGGEKTTIIALNKNTGEKVWVSKSLNENAAYASPLLIEKGNKKQVLSFTENYLFSVNPEDGSMQWKFEFGKYTNSRNNQTNTPLFYNNEIYLTSGYDHKSVMLSLNNNWSGVSVKWVDSVLDVHHGGVVLVDGYIYGANWLHNRMGNWTCLNWETGKVKYSQEWLNKGSVIAADGMLYCYEEKHGHVGIAPVNPDKFEIVSSFKVPYGDDPYWAHPVIDKGKLFMRSATAIMVYNIKQD